MDCGNPRSCLVEGKVLAERADGELRPQEAFIQRTLMAGGGWRGGV